MTYRLRVFLGLFAFLLSCLAGAAPPKGWLPHSPSAELGDAASANVVRD